MKKLITLFFVSLLVTTSIWATTFPISATTGKAYTAVLTEITNAANAGNTDITVTFDNNVIWGTSSSNISNFTIPAKVTKLTFTSANTATSSTIPVLYIRNIVFSDALMTGGMILNGLKIYDTTASNSDYFIQPASSNAAFIPASLTIQNCWVEGYRAVFFSSLATTTSSVIFFNNYFKNIGASGIINVNTGSIPIINIKKNTFNNVGGDASGTTAVDYFIDFRSANAVTSQINFSNNTIYYPRTQGRGLFRLPGAFTTGYIKENNNLYSTGNVSSYALQLLYTNVTAATTDAVDSTNYYSNKMTLGSNKGSILTAVYTENSPSNLFVNPGSDNFTINDPNFAGKLKTGNPSCYYPETILLNGGTSNISLTSLNYTEGSGPSGYTTFTISAYVPRSVITLTPPVGYEISADGGANYYDSSTPVTLGTANTDLTSTTVLVRLKAGLTNAASPYNGNISVTTNTGTSKTVACSGTINSASLPVLSTPSKPSFSSLTSRGFHASWSAVTNADKYDLKLTQGATTTTISDIATTSYDVSGLTGGTDYSFTIIAKANSGYSSSLESPASDVISTPNITLTTSVSSDNGAGTGGTVSASPSQTYYNVIGSTVSLTATRGFGYQFVNWVDVNNSNAVISTSNPLNNYAMNSSQNIQAVFQSIPTYTFSLNKAGSGANFGEVTVSPAATGGKYETGTVVTATVVPNSVSSFVNWEDNSTTSNHSITVNAPTTVIPTFDILPFIAGWNFKTDTPKSARSGDYYSDASNMGTISLYEQNGTVVSWLSHSGWGSPATPCAIKWTGGASFSTNQRYFQASFSTNGYKNIRIRSKMCGSYQYYTTQILQASLDGSTFTNITFVDISSSTWRDVNFDLPSTYDNQPTVYIRWVANTSSTRNGNTTDNDGTSLTSVYVFADLLFTASAGDFIAKQSGDISTAANWKQTDGYIISQTAASAPASSDNLWIPAGITMTNSASATCNQLKIRGTYSAGATMNATGGIVVQSDSTGTGAILDNGNTISGSATVQQYVSGTSGTVPRGWWYVSSPVSNATASVFSLDGTHRLWAWDEPTVAYQEITSGSTALNVGQGYAYSNGGTDATLSFTGTLNTGDITVNLTRTGTTAAYRGYSLVGNPYPSYLNWNAASKTNVRSTIWYRTWTKGGQMQFDTYDGTTGTGVGMRGTVSQYIPPMQGFWVKVDTDPVDPATTSAGSITFHNADRLYKDQTLQTNRLRTKAENSTEPGIVRLRVSNGTNSDEAILVSDPNASDAADKFDSPKMKNNNAEIPEIYTVADSEELVINHLNNFSAGKTFPLGFRPGKVSDFSIVANEISNVSSDLKMVLMDNLTNTCYDLTDGSAYTFSADATASASRFSVQFKSVGMVSGTNQEIVGKTLVYENALHQIAVQLNYESVTGTLSVYNSIGEKLMNQEMAGNTISINRHFIPGVYLVELNVNNQRIVKKVVIR